MLEVVSSENPVARSNPHPSLLNSGLLEPRPWRDKLRELRPNGVPLGTAHYGPAVRPKGVTADHGCQYSAKAELAYHNRQYSPDGISGELTHYK